MRDTLLIAAGAGLLAFVVGAVAADDPTPSPTPLPPQRALKVTVRSALLFESPEMADECAGARGRAKTLRTQADARPAGGRRDVEAATELDRRAQAAIRDADATCDDAVAATLVKGTLLTALREKGGFLMMVRVETGRAGGKVGWVSRGDVMFE